MPRSANGASDFAPDPVNLVPAVPSHREHEPENLPLAVRNRGTENRPLRIYAFGVSRNRLEQAIQSLRVPAGVVRDPREADIVLTLKNYYRQKAQPVRDAEARGTPVYVLRSNTGIQMEQLLISLFPGRGDRSELPVEPHNAPDDDLDDEGGDPVLSAISEAEDAIAAVMGGGSPVQLAPQSNRIRQGFNGSATLATLLHVAGLLQTPTVGPST